MGIRILLKWQDNSKNSTVGILQLKNLLSNYWRYSLNLTIEGSQKHLSVCEACLLMQLYNKNIHIYSNMSIYPILNKNLCRL